VNDDARASELLDAFCAALQRGEAPDPSAWLARVNDPPPGLLDDLRTVASLHGAAQSIGDDAGDDAGPTPRAVLAPETRVGDCVIKDLVGYGGMGEVYFALHEKLGREVAVKVLRGHLAGDRAAAERFRSECASLTKIGKHPNVVTALEAGEHEGAPYLVMEYMPGVDLGRRVAGGPLPVADACDYARQAALGLAHAHKHGIVHRDVKPSNLLLTRDGTVKLLDLGLARRALRPPSEEASRAFQDELVGSLDYMAPEQADDPSAADARSDLYSLGCTFYCFLAGRPPFADRLRLKKLLAHAKEPPPSIRAIRADVPDAVAALLDRMLAKEPSARPASAEELARAIEAARAGRAAVVSRRRTGWAWIALAALIGVVIGAGVALLATRSSPSPLAPGAPVQGELTTDDPVSPKSHAPFDTYAVEVERGVAYAITMRSRTFDPQLSVSGAWDRAESTDAPNLGDTAQVIWVAQATETIDVLATAEGSEEIGGYLLSIEVCAEPALETRAAGALARSDRTLSDGSSYDLYRLMVTTGESYVVRMRSRAFEPYLFLQDDEASWIDSAGPEDGVATVTYTARESGALYVGANSVEASNEGAYTLEVQRLAAGDVISSTRGRLEDGDARLREDDSFYDSYPLAATADRTYVVTMRSEELDAFLLLLDEHGARLAVSDDVFGTDARIVYRAETTAPLRVLANSASAGETGAYTLEIREAR
jgi:hypothetical protein